MKRFIRAFFVSLAVYVVGGYVVVASLFLLGFVGWSDGPSQPLISGSVPERLQRVWAFGVFASPSLASRVFTDPGKVPWIERDASPERNEIYAKEIKAYYQRVRDARDRSALVGSVWAVIASAVIASVFILTRPRHPNERIA